MDPGGVLFDVLFLLLAAVAVVPVLQRFGIPSVLGYLVAGTILGPYTPGPVINAEATRPLAEFGVVFLLFAIGLELPLSRLRTMRTYIFGLGLLQVVLTGAVLAIAAGMAGLKLEVALVVGLTLAMSSTATAVALLVERSESVSHHGRIAVSILIFQDLAVIPLLALLPLLAERSLHFLPSLGLAGLKAALAVAAIFAFGRLMLRPAYAFVATSRSPEVFVAANLLLVLTVAWLTKEAGMSMALGAFLGGLMLADSPYRHQIEADIQPFRGLLLGLFFMTVGMSINLPFVGTHIGQIVGITAALLTIKAVIIVGLCWLMKAGFTNGLRVGCLLAQTGEFAFVLLDQAVKLRLLDSGTGQTLLAVTALSMVLTPGVVGLGGMLAARRRAREGESLAPSGVEHSRDHVVMAGYGRTGRAVGRLLMRHGIPFVALELDVEKVTAARKMKLPVYYGDAANPGVLRSAGIGGARAAVITMGKPQATEKAVVGIRQIVPGLPIIVRAQDRIHEAALSQVGATAIVPETVEASLQMAAEVLRQTGVAEAEVEISLNDYRRNRYQGERA
jgi:monovalent cation:H+ antiporter-2, CPA2 family